MREGSPLAGCYDPLMAAPKSRQSMIVGTNGRQLTVIDRASESFHRPTGYYRGGAYNELTGMGGEADKSRGTMFQATGINSRWFLSNIYRESWAAAKMINAPIDDMFVKEKRYIGDDGDEAVESVEKVRRMLMLDNRISRAMKGARLYGTSALVLVFGDGSDSHTELDMERIGPDYPLNAVHVTDRFCMEAEESTRITEVSSPHFGEADIYHVYPKDVAGMNQPRWRVHRTRLIRFDGREALSMFGWMGYTESEWGLSLLQYAIQEIMHDVGLSQSVSHLGQEASVGVYKVAGMRNALTGDAAEGDVTPEMYGSMANRNRSIYRSIFLDEGDDYSRVSVNFGGLSDLLNIYASRLAAMADIPETRFMGSPPSGFNATGESDMANYAIHVAARQAQWQAGAGDRLDDIIALSAGVPETPEVEWPSLLEVRGGDRAMEVKTATEALSIAFKDGIYDEAHYAERLAQYDDIFGTPPEPQVLTPEERGLIVNLPEDDDEGGDFPDDDDGEDDDG